MKNKLLFAALCSVIITILHLILFNTYLGRRFEPMALDVWFNLQGRVTPPPGLGIIAMDEASYNDLGLPLNQGWPRAVHAKLLQRLKDLGARGAVFDVLFLDPGLDPKADQDLAEAMKGLPVYLGAESSTSMKRDSGGSFVIEEFLKPYEPFEKSAAGLALVGLPEEYGVVRRFHVGRTENSYDYPTLAEAAAGLIQPSFQKPKERDFIRYYGPANTVPTYSYYQVLQDDRPLPRSWFEGKVFFVGLVLRSNVGPAQKDIYGSPYFGESLDAQGIFGTEIHAISALNLANHDWISRLSSFSENALLALIGFVVCGCILYLPPLWGGLLTIFAALVWVLCSYLGFRSGLFVPGILLSVIVLPLTFLSATLYYYFVTRQQAQQIQSAFQLYLSPEMASQMSENKSALTLGGEKMWATALFTDISDFSSITEDMPAEKVSAMLNAYFTEVMDVIFTNQGTLIKFIGDAVFGLWGAPIRLNNHAELATKTAMEMQVQVERFNNSGRFPSLHTRIGVHTGPMVVGNLGSQKRFDYTAIGDSVNLASRIEGINKYFGTKILISETTKKEMGGAIATIPIAQVQVVGKKEVVGLFTVANSRQEFREVEKWESALTAFSEQRWDEAMTAFGAVHDREEKLRMACEFYLHRIAKMKQETLPPGWHGEIMFSSK